MLWKTLVLMLFFYILYLCLGAGVYYGLEYTRELNICHETITQIQSYVAQIEAGPPNQTVTQGLIRLMANLADYGVQMDDSLNLTCAHNWYYQNAFFFSGTVITTIGYGNITPQTPGGQIFTIFYAIFGIPFFGIMFAGIGDNFARIFRRVQKKIMAKMEKNCKKKPSSRRAKWLDKKWMPNAIILTFALLVLLVLFSLIPAIVFLYVEEWTYLQAFYYTFITMTTIGFGDYVVGADPNKSYSSIYKICVYFWIIFGLAFMATVVSLIADLIKDTAPEKHIDSRKEDEEVTEDNGNACLKHDEEGFNNIMIQRENSKTPLPKAAAQLPEVQAINEENA